MSSITVSELEAGARAQGFDEVLVRQWPPMTVLANVYPPPGSRLTCTVAVMPR